MPTSIGHACVAVLATPLLAPPDRRVPVVWTAAACAAAPDLDAIGWIFGGHDTAWLGGHRGLTHSLLVALVAAGIVAALSRRHWHLQSLRRTFTYFAVIIASHGLLDCLTTYGLGVKVLAPFSMARFSAPFHPISEVSELFWLWLPALIAMRMNLGGLVRQSERH